MRFGMRLWSKRQACDVVVCLLHCVLSGCFVPVVSPNFVEEKTALVSAGRVAYWMTGSGDAVLLCLHDLGSEKGIWHDFVKGLAWEGRIVALDLRGHGASEAPGDGDFSVAAAALDVVGLLDRIEAVKVVMVGHGWGGQVALSAARLAEAGRVKGVMLVDAMPEMSQLAVVAQRGFLESVMAPEDANAGVGLLVEPLLDGLDEEQRLRVMEAARRFGRGRMIAGYQGMFLHEAAKDVAAYRGALLAVVGDANTGPLALQNVAGDLPFREIRAKGHFLMLTAALELREALNDFLAILQAD